MGCECFDAKVSLVAIYKGFKDAHKFGDTPLEGGLKAIKHTVDDIWSRGREIKSPIDAYFRTKLERRINSRTGKEELFWEGYDRSIRESMRRNVAWLRLNKASAEKIEQAKLEYHDWVEAEKTILDSNGHIPVRFFSAKDGDVTLGMALHQVSGQDGELVLESQLLPIEQMDQMEVLMGLVEKVREPIDFKQELPVMVRESSWVNQQDLGMPIHTMTESMSGGAGIGMGDVHLGSGHEAVSVTEALVYALPVVVADAQPHPRGGVELARPPEPITTIQVEKYKERKSVKGVKVWDTEVIMENLPVGGWAGILVPPHPRGGVEVVAEKVVVPQVMRLIPVGDEIRVAALQPVADRQVVEEVITENTEVTEGTEEVVVPTVTRMIPVDKVIEDTVSHLRGVIKAEVSESTEKVMAPQVTLPDVHLGSVHGLVEVRMEEGITEATEITEGIETLVVSDSSDQAEGRKEFKSVKIEVFNYDSVLLVIKEAFNEKLAKLKSINSVKAKVIGLQRQVANILADQLMGRNIDEPVLGWLVHGWAMMRFDGIEEKQKVRRFRLSPVRLWADRVTRVVRRVKDKFVRTGFGVYKYLFAAI